MRDLIIYGAGGLGREVAEVINSIDVSGERWNFLGYADDNLAIGSSDGLGDYKVLGGLEFIKNFGKPLDVVIAIAKTRIKRKIYEELNKFENISFPKIISPHALIYSRVEIGEGVIIAPFCLVSVNVKLGRCVFLNYGTHVGHDSELGDFCSVMPDVDISGHVVIGRESLIGVNAAILQGLSVGERATVGMGSIVLKPVADGWHVLGNPAAKF